MSEDTAASSRREWLDGVSHWAERIARSRAFVITAFTLLYVIPTVRLARIKLFWDDEFFTLYLSRTPDWITLQKALATGADQHPPSFYYLTHWILQIAGTSHITMRIPAIAGFWLLCVCLYEITRPLTSPLWATVAMLFPLTTNLYYYATEARGYGLVTGFTALAVLAWMRASSGRRRGFYIPLLAFGLAAAVASHYYAALAVVCLAAGELIRTLLRRKIDWPVWFAFAFTGAPVLFFLGTIQSAKGYSKHFWAVPYWFHALYFYPNELGLGPIAIVGVLGAAVCFGITPWNARHSKAAATFTGEPLNRYQAAAICSLCLLPFVAMTAAKFVTHGFTPRYAIAAIVGITIFFVCLLYRVLPQSPAALVAMLVCLWLIGTQVFVYRAKFYGLHGEVASDINVLGKTGTQEIAVSEITVFHRVSFYAPRQLATRLTLVADPESSIKYLGHDTVDRGLLDLNPWFPLKVLPKQLFLNEHREFLVYGGVGNWNWLTFDLPKWGETKLLERNGERLLLSEQNVRFLADADQLKEQHEKARAMLYWKTPQTGPSLCRLYMGMSQCP